jgi:hypothetical protein
MRMTRVRPSTINDRSNDRTLPVESENRTGTSQHWTYPGRVEHQASHFCTCSFDNQQRFASGFSGLVGLVKVRETRGRQTPLQGREIYRAQRVCFKFLLDFQDLPRLRSLARKFLEHLMERLSNSTINKFCSRPNNN